MINKLIFLFGALLLLVACSSSKENENQKNKEFNDENYYNQIFVLLSQNQVLKEVDFPDSVSMPEEISKNQVSQILKIGNLYFALVSQPSMNVVLNLPADFEEKFAGILVANTEDKQWSKFIQLKDEEPTNKNNPYLLQTKNGKLYLGIVDQNGAGSGEGILKVFVLEKTKSWVLNACYYYPASENIYSDFTDSFSSYETVKLDNCNNVNLTVNF